MTEQLLIFKIGSGYDLTFRSPKDDAPGVFDSEVPAFAHVIILASDVKSQSNHTVEHGDKC